MVVKPNHDGMMIMHGHQVMKIRKYIKKVVTGSF